MGLTLFVTLLVAAFRALSTIRRGPLQDGAALAQILTASLVGFVVGGCFLSEAYSTYLYALLGMVLGLARLARLARPARPARPVPQRAIARTNLYEQRAFALEPPSGGGPVILS